MIELDTALTQEIETEQLGDIDESFFERVAHYIKKLENHAYKTSGIDNDILIAEISEVKNKISQLFDLRMRKIVCFNDSNLITDEQKIFKQVLSLKMQYRKELLEPILRGEYAFERDGFIKAKVRIQIPSFLGEDLRKYGPYKPGDVDHFPEKIHTLLKERGLID